MNGNTILGFAAQSNTDGMDTCYNVTVGMCAGVSNESISPGNITNSGSCSVYIGHKSGHGCEDSFGSSVCRASIAAVMIGYESGKCAKRTDGSVFLGYGTGACGYMGDDAVLIGHGSGQLGVMTDVAEGSNVTAVGHNTFYSARRGRYSTMVGFNAGYYLGCNATACENTIVGECAGFCMFGGNANTAVGLEAMGAYSSGNNVCFNVVTGLKGAPYLGATLFGCNQATLQTRYNVAIGAYYAGFCSSSAGQQWVEGECNVIIGNCTCICNGTDNSIGIGNKVAVTSSNSAVLGNCSVHTLGVCFHGCVIKSSGSFTIKHPDPKLNKTKKLNHSFIESPTAGDNIYRWSINTKDCNYKLELPNYFKYLNKNTTVKISPVGHFGRAYGSVSEDGHYLNICSNKDGKFNILAIGTRCDDDVKRLGFDLEKDMSDFDIKRCAKGCFYGYK
tara:strand:- start:354 stop:1691 length:1338 start_codon:yes stop_codon:yes gene_type:complete